MTTIDILDDVTEAMFAMDKLLKRTKDVQATYSKLERAEHQDAKFKMSRAAFAAAGASVAVEIKLLEAMRAIAAFNGALQGLNVPLSDDEAGQMALWD